MYGGLNNGCVLEWQCLVGHKYGAFSVSAGRFPCCGGEVDDSHLAVNDFDFGIGGVVVVEKEEFVGEKRYFSGSDFSEELRLDWFPALRAFAFGVKENLFAAVRAVDQVVAEVFNHVFPFHLDAALLGVVQAIFGELLLELFPQPLGV